MALNIGIGYKDKFTSEAINDKFSNLIGGSNLILGNKTISGFLISPLQDALGISLSAGTASIDGVIIEDSVSHAVTVAMNTSGSEQSAYLVGEYNHKLSEIVYSLVNSVTNDALLSAPENILSIGHVYLQNNATRIDISDIITYASHTIDLKSVKDLYTEDLENLLIPSKDLAEQINATITGQIDLLMANSEIANLKLYQSAGSRLNGTDISLFGTDFSADLGMTRDTTLKNPSGATSSGQAVIQIASTTGLVAKKEVTIEEGVNIERKIIQSLTSNSITLSTNLIYSYTTAAKVYRSDDNICETAKNKDIRIEISTATLKEGIVSAILYCTKRTNIIYTVYASVSDIAIDESFTQLTLVDSTDFLDNTQELIFTGIVDVPATKITLKINIANTSGYTATITRILGAL